MDEPHSLTYLALVQKIAPFSFVNSIEFSSKIKNVCVPNERMSIGSKTFISRDDSVIPKFSSLFPEFPLRNHGRDKHKP